MFGLFKKSSILLLSILSTSTALAMKCDYESLNHIPIVFSDISQKQSIKNRDKLYLSNVYPHFVSDYRHYLPINYQEYYAREAKIDFSQKIVRLETDRQAEEFGKKKRVYYYPAIANNCNTLYLRVDSSLPYLKRKYFREDSDNFELNFFNEEAFFNFYFKQRFDSYKNGGVKYVWTRAYKNGVLPAHSLDPVLPLTRLKIIGIDTKPFIDQYGNQISNYSLVVVHSGKKGTIPSSKQLLVDERDIHHYYINQDYYPLIRSGKIAYGMNRNEVLFAWGEPQKVILNPIYQQQSGAKKIFYNFYDVGSKSYVKFENFMVNQEKQQGYEQFWYYPEKLGEQFLVFDADGIYHKSAQFYDKNIH